MGIVSHIMKLASKECNIYIEKRIHKNLYDYYISIIINKCGRRSTSKYTLGQHLHHIT